MEDWILEAAIGSSYVYFDWQDSTIKAIDLTMYEIQFDQDVGTISLIRRDGNSSYEQHRKKFWEPQPGPSREWLSPENPEIRPLTYPYLHKIPLKEEQSPLRKNPYLE